MNQDSQFTAYPPNVPEAQQLPQQPPLPQVPVAGSSPWPGEGAYKDSIGWALWCLFFIGLGGVHRIYLGKYGTGILWLLTWGLFGVGQFLDLFRMKSLVRDSNIRDGYLPHPRYAQQLGRPAAPPAQQLASSQPSLMQVILKVAQENGGALTVTQAVAATGLSFEKVEEVLGEMVAKGYVDVDNVPQSGVIVYRFPELTGPFH
jgi:hypothetical protein